jgi:hypothetical protein
MEMTSVRGKISNPLANRILPAIENLRDTLVNVTKTGGKYSTTNLAYPLNVEGDPQQGHYISFYARVTDPAKLKAVKAAQGRIDAINKRLASEGGPPGRNFKLSNLSVQKIEGLEADKALVSAGGSSGVKSNSIRLKRGTTVRTKTAISLYMPPSVQVSYESKYGDQEISMLAETGYNAIKGFMTGNSAKEQVMSALEDGGQIIKNMALAALETAAPGAKALFAIDRGKIIAPKMELMFEGIGRRNFSFAFVFIPKSEQEAQVVKDIIYKFKHHMAADYVGGGASGQREMSFPDMFDIEYMHVGKQNPNLNKIATCALTKMDVEYGGDRYVAYEGGVPQTTKLSLNFQEFDIITKKHIEAGF